MYFKGNDFRNHQRRLWYECSFDPPMQSYLYLLLHLPRNPRISCRVLSNVQLWEGSVQCVQLCNCALWEFPLFQVSALCKWACFCPPAIIPCCVVKMRVQLGDKSQLEWHDPPRIGRSHCATPKTLPKHCHSIVVCLAPWAILPPPKTCDRAWGN